MILQHCIKILENYIQTLNCCITSLQYNIKSLQHWIKSLHHYIKTLKHYNQILQSYLEIVYHYFKALHHYITLNHYTKTLYTVHNQHITMNSKRGKLHTAQYTKEHIVPCTASVYNNTIELKDINIVCYIRVYQYTTGHSFQYSLVSICHPFWSY